MADKIGCWAGDALAHLGWGSLLLCSFFPPWATSLAMSQLLRERRHLVLAGMVLLVEYLAISLSFDAQLVAGRGGAWDVLGQVGQLGPLLIVGVTAFLLSAPRSEPARNKALDATSSRLIFEPRWLFLHALSYAGFFALTALAFGDEVPSGPATIWLVGWCLAGITTGGTLVLGVVPQMQLVKRLLAQLLAAGGLLGLLAWFGGVLTTEAWPYLARATFITVASLLSLTDMELLADTSQFILELEGFVITIAPVCSGVEGMGLFVVLMGAFLFRLRSDLRFPLALLLLPVGMAAIWFGNALRIAGLMIVGARLDPALAIGSFHSKAGWVFFCAITLAIAAGGRALFGKDASKDSERVSASNPVAPLLMPLIVWIAVGMVTSAFAQGHDPLYPLRVLITAAVLFGYRKSYASWFQRPSLAALSVGAVVGVLWVAVPEVFFGETPQSPPSVGSPLLSVTWVVFRCLGAIVLIPICEELAFRSFLARKLSGADFADVSFRDLSLFGIVASSIAFGALHHHWHLAALTGCVYSVLLKKTGRLQDAIHAHALSNAVIAIWVLATGNYQHW